jgi:hypothetical protein
VAWLGPGPACCKHEIVWSSAGVFGFRVGHLRLRGGGRGHPKATAEEYAAVEGIELTDQQVCIFFVLVVHYSLIVHVCVRVPGCWIVTRSLSS